MGCLLLARNKASQLHHLSTDNDNALHVKATGNETTQETNDHVKKQKQQHNLQVWNRSTFIIPSVENYTKSLDPNISIGSFQALRVIPDTDRSPPLLK